MKRSLFIASLAVAALTLTSVRIAAARRVPRQRISQAGSCANRRRRLRWPSYTAADFT
jgi:hypothetical protein